MSASLPNLLETTLGVFLHDIGKLLQRAHGSSRKLSGHTQNLEGTLLPWNQQGGYYTHKHVLWSEEFFDWVKNKAGANPRLGINWQAVRDVAVFHHRPDAATSEIGPLGWLAAEADRLASGMDRKPKDEEAEVKAERGAWDAFIKTAQISPFSGVRIGRGDAPRVQIELGELVPGPGLVPKAGVNTAKYQALYLEIWERMRAEIEAALGLDNAAVFCEALLSISERFLFAVPSSTMDEPDVSLHDHSRAAAAIAAAMYRWHESRGSLGDEAAVKNRDLKKYRLLAGDLSGIQHTLFLLASQRVKGANRMLRARSFLFGAVADAAALAARRTFGLPVFSLVQNAGGRFVLLVPDTEDCVEKVETLRDQVDPWMMNRYRGELALNLALGEPFAGADFADEMKLREAMRQLSEAVDESKVRAFSRGYQAVHRDAVYQEQACAACGVRPDEHVERLDGGEELRLCGVCRDEQRLGRDLPRITHLAWREGPPQGQQLGFFGGLSLERIFERPRAHDALSLIRIWRGASATAPGPFALRFVANYVPVIEPKDVDDPRYRMVARDAGQGEEPPEPGDIKTFEHLAAAALSHEDGQFRGQPFLGVLKADVDWLGFIFGRGIQHTSFSRIAALSRTMDFFFTGYLHHILENDFPNTYTVYAGGDDLLLIGPWEDMLNLASKLRREFHAWTGGNPNLTLSAGVELMKPNHPVNRTALAAEERLEKAKKARGGDGKAIKDHVSAIADEPVSWSELERQLKQADTLTQYLRDGWLSQVFVYRLLAFDRLRRRAEAKPKHGEPVKLDLEAAPWRAKWGYQLARNVRDNKNVPKEHKTEIEKLLNGLLGVDQNLQRIETEDPSPRIAVSVALYRNRKYTERR